jgi:hypothetical protein
MGAFDLEWNGSEAHLAAAADDDDEYVYFQI